MATKDSRARETGEREPQGFESESHKDSSGKAHEWRAPKVWVVLRKQQPTFRSPTSGSNGVGDRSRWD